MHAESDADLLTIAEAARWLRVSTVTLHRWLKTGRLPAYRIGPRAVRIRREDLMRMVTPTTPEEARAAAEPQSPAVQATVRPLTDEEKRRTLAALATARELGERILARRGGQPLDESWPIIRAAREQRSRQL
jgi:excisionase family DNA binding protein